MFWVSLLGYAIILLWCIPGVMAAENEDDASEEVSEEQKKLLVEKMLEVWEIYFIVSTVIVTLFITNPCAT